MKLLNASAASVYEHNRTMTILCRIIFSRCELRVCPSKPRDWKRKNNIGIKIEHRLSFLARPR